MHADGACSRVQLKKLYKVAAALLPTYLSEKAGRQTLFASPSIANRIQKLSASPPGFFVVLELNTERVREAKRKEIHGFGPLIWIEYLHSW